MSLPFSWCLLVLVTGTGNAAVGSKIEMKAGRKLKWREMPETSKGESWYRNRRKQRSILRNREGQTYHRGSKIEVKDHSFVRSFVL